MLFFRRFFSYPGRCAVVTSMNIGVIFVSAILSLFPTHCDLQKTEETSNNSIVSRIVFPTDHRKSPSLRIIGGSEAIPNSYPFQAALYIANKEENGFLVCGGTLITPEWVLTAAHCLEKDNYSYAIIFLGAHNLTAADDADEPNRIFHVINNDSVVLHEDYVHTSTTVQNDIALIHLPTNVTLTPYIQTVNYNTDDDKSFEGEIGTIIGWGRTAFGGNMSATLKQASESIISNKECAELLRDDVEIFSSHLCTSGGETGRMCQGDSGGPLLINRMQIGIISLTGDNCTVASVYTRVSHFSDWIYRVTHGLPTGARHTSDGCRIFTSLRFMVVISTIVYLSTY